MATVSTASQALVKETISSLCGITSSDPHCSRDSPDFLRVSQRAFSGGAGRNPRPTPAICSVQRPPRRRGIDRQVSRGGRQQLKGGHGEGVRSSPPSAQSAEHSGGDPELHFVLELASDAELSELSNILYGKSLLSPILKSVTTGDGAHSDSVFDVLSYEGEPEGGREGLLRRLEARFLYLAADAGATLSGRRPTYRDALLQVKEKLRVPCSTKLSTADLEAEIFLHLLQEYSSRPKTRKGLRERRLNEPLANSPEDVRNGSLRSGVFAALRLGGEELLSIAVKGGSAVTMSTLQELALGKLSAKVLLEKARYNVAKEALVKGGQVVAAKLETHLAFLVAKQGFAGAATRYAALRSAAMLLGPMLWGLFMADVVLRSVGTDYARVVRAVFAFAQIRLTRTYGWSSVDEL